MKQYLIETLQLLHWAFCCPSRLQARMNAWGPRPYLGGFKPDTVANDILLFDLKRRFATQFLLLVTGLTLPLMMIILVQGSLHDSWLPLMVLLAAYGLGIQAITPGLSLPFFLTLAYLARPSFFVQALTVTLNTFSPYRQLALNLLGGCMMLVAVILIVYSLLQAKHVIVARFVIIVGSGLAIRGGSWLVSQDWRLLLLLGGNILFLLWLLRQRITTTNNVGIIAVVVAGGLVGGLTSGLVGGPADILAVVLAVIMAVGVAGGLAGGLAVVLAVGMAVGLASSVAGMLAFSVSGVWAGVLAGVLAGGLAGIVMVGLAVAMTGGLIGGRTGGLRGIVSIGLVACLTGIISLGLAGTVSALATAQPIIFLTTAWLVGVLFTPLSGYWRALLLSSGIAIFGFAAHGILALWAIPVLLLGYYRFFPFQLGWAVFVYSTQVAWLRHRFAAPIALLHQLPPYQDEFVWRSLPGHAAILEAAMRQESGRALAVWQRLQASPMSGFRLTAQAALPQIVADQIGAATTTGKLIQVATTDHPYLPRLLPGFYAETTENTVYDEMPQPEIAVILPSLQTLASDVAAALASENIALRERGLERVLDQLRLLQGQLPGKGVSQAGIRRWQQVFARWEEVLERELAHQRNLGQGELVNPFQVGNPLRPNRTDLFKGRNALAEQIVRLVLDRSRPTLALHGPRRMGKSSFLLNLPRLLPSSILPVYLDIQESAATNSEGDFCYSLVRAMRNDSRSQGVDLPAPDRATFKRAPYPALQDWLDAVLPLLGERRLLLNLDEFEKLGEAITAGRLSLRLFDQLRHLIQHNDALGFLFSGMQTVEELGPNWSSYFISVEQFNLLYLTQAEAEQLLTDPDPAFKLQYAPGLVEEIIAVTRGHPYLLQLVGANLVKQVNAHQMQIATEPLLEAALQNAFTEAPAYFTEVWKLYREFTGQPPAEVMAGRRLLLAAAAGQPLEIDDDMITQSALRRLIRYHILEQIGNSYQVEIPLVARWVRERARLDAEL